MTNRDTLKWAQENLGTEEIAYPTHPVVVACMVMDRYANLEQACSREPGAQYGRALQDDFIPGSGCAVWAGLDVLRHAQSGNLSDALALAESYWENVARNFPQRPQENTLGRSQGAQLQAALQARLQVWGTENDKGSRYRRTPVPQGPSA
jgi:hypothetical protein